MITGGPIGGGEACREEKRREEESSSPAGDISTALHVSPQVER